MAEETIRQLEDQRYAAMCEGTNVWIKGPKGWQMVAWPSTPLPA